MIVERTVRKRYLITLCSTARYVMTVVLLATGATSASAQISNEQCQKCHGETSIASMRPESLAAMISVPPGQQPQYRPPAEIGQLFVAPEALKQSAHAGLNCVDCHLGSEKLPHPQRLQQRSCQDCHADVKQAMDTTPHGSAGDRSPSCADCHGSAHQVSSFSTPRTFHEAQTIVQRCSACHASPDARGMNPATTYHDNVHGDALLVKGLALSATCVDCHGHHAILPSTDPKSQISPQNAPETCGRCHEGISEVFFASVHGKTLAAGEKMAASCTSCHSSHGIAEVNNRFLHEIVQECSVCHLDLGKSYLASFHGKATELGAEETAICSSCHGAHDILPKSDPRSHVSAQNLQATCAKCHEYANENFIKYMVHVDYRNPRDSLIVFYTWLGMTTLLLGVLAVFIPHSLLWLQRAFGEKGYRRHGLFTQAHGVREIRRFQPIHRLVHALIIVSFMGLVATGFPIKYSYTEWAHSLANLFGGIGVMRVLHRGLAVITFLYAGIHLGWLVYFFVAKCPRPRRRYLLGPNSMVFSMRDLRDALAMARWFFRRGPRPTFERWTYFEKFDYWGEIWGVIIIGGTGLMLWLPTFFTRWLPGWTLNIATVVHSIEALLAASIIFLVHFFNTHLRPGKFPIDMVMLTGQMSEEEMKEERLDEYQRLVAEGQLEERVVPPVSRRYLIVGTIAGIVAFMIGITLIFMAVLTEIRSVFG